MPERLFGLSFQLKGRLFGNKEKEKRSSYKEDTTPSLTISEVESLAGRLCVAEARALLPHHDFNSAVSWGEIENERLSELSSSTKEALSLGQEQAGVSVTKVALHYKPSGPNGAWIRLAKRGEKVRFLLRTQPDQVFCEMQKWDDKDKKWQCSAAPEGKIISDAKKIMNLVEEGVAS